MDGGVEAKNNGRAMPRDEKQKSWILNSLKVTSSTPVLFRILSVTPKRGGGAEKRNMRRANHECLDKRTECGDWRTKPYLELELNRHTALEEKEIRNMRNWGHSSVESIHDVAGVPKYRATREGARILA